jgi:fructokinase
MKGKEMDALDIICLGELLIDFVSLDRDASLAESTGFKKAPGGAPANVAAGVARLGLKAGFIGKVGNDPFGAYLRGVLDNLRVDTEFLVADPDARTTLSFVAQKSDGVRDCMFYRNPGADMLLRPEELDAVYFEGSTFFHFGSISLGAEPVKSATLKAIEMAKGKGLLISYDPNLRMSLWPDEETARREINAGFPYADIVKISEEEYGFILGCETPESCADAILAMGPKLVVVTLGPKGCYYSDGSRTGYLPTFEDVTVVETTGAGDAFVAATLAGITARLKQGDPDAFRADDSFVRILTFANAAGSLATTKLGAIPSLPTSDEVLAFLAVH